MKHSQESALEFRRQYDPDAVSGEKPAALGLIVFQAGGTLEQRIEAARKTFFLGLEWQVIDFEPPKAAE
jgi:hypothetical protein